MLHGAPAEHCVSAAGRTGKLSQRLAQQLAARGIVPDICNRLARYYDELLIDEVHDFAGHDFNYLLDFCRADISVLCCGDFY